ncbi:MAG: dicarboxylate/amino acid:cation symporter [Planctomycetes bacterium]|nr:dicarboxylate/amino acid:cation symporter [Planctomycetota bacterium]
MSSKWLLTILILVGLVLGTIVGQLLYDPDFKLAADESTHAHATWLKVFTFLGNTVFMGLLKMLIIPLIATSVIVGVTSVGDFRQLGRIGGWTLVYYFATMLIAVTIGLFLVTTFEPGKAIGAEQRKEAEVSYATDTDKVQALETKQKEGLLGAIRGLAEQIIPRNVVAAAAGGQPLPIIFFSIFFGVVVTMVGPKGRIISEFFEATFVVMMQMVHAVIWLAPVGVFALLAWTVARIGLAVFAGAISTYMFVVLFGLAIHAFVILPTILWVFTRGTAKYTNPYKFFNQMRQALLTAVGTDSSSATLPVTIECATEVAGVSKRSAGFVLPLGSTINMDGTALYEAVAVVFLAQAYGFDLGLPTLILIAITATLAAVGAAGIPSAGLVTMVIVLDAVNTNILEGDPAASAIPIAAIGLIIGVDRILDMFRTATNVWGDAVGAKIIDRLCVPTTAE